MKKTAIAILIAAITIILCAGFVSCAASESYEGFNVKANADGTYTVVGYTGSATEVIVPVKLNDVLVTAIGDKAFSGNAKITKVVLPDSVTKIGSAAFINCTALVSVEGGKYEVVSTSAFAGCTLLTDVKLPDTLKEIGYRAFATCRSLASIDIPVSVKTIRHYAFADCTSLSAFNIAGDGLSVYANAFAGCSSLKSISTPEGGAKDAIYTFSEGVMYSADGKTIVSFILDVNEYTIKAGVEAIAPGAFYGKTSLLELKVAEGNTAFKVDGGVLFSADGKTLIVYPAGKTGDAYEIPAGTEAIAACAFSANPLLKGVKVPATVTSIGKSAFEGCISLGGIDASEVTATVGEKAFAGILSNDLTYIITDTAPAYKLIGGVLYSADETTLVSYPANKAGADFTVPASVKSIAPRAFALAGELTAIKFAEGNTSFTSVGGALYSADKTVLYAVPAKLAGEFTAEATVTTLAAGAFEGCSAITKIVIPATVTEIPVNAFKDCAALAELTIQGAAAKIGSFAFSGCDALVTVNYGGTEAQWASAKAGSEGNGILDAVTVNCNAK